MLLVVRWAYKPTWNGALPVGKPWLCRKLPSNHCVVAPPQRGRDFKAVHLGQPHGVNTPGMDQDRLESKVARGSEAAGKFGADAC